MRVHDTSRPTTSTLRLAGSLVAVALLAAGGLADTGRHAIERGETLAGIAREHGTTVATLAGANAIGNPNLIVAGRTLVIPETSHTVTAGETLAGIARRYSTTVGALASTNHLANANLIRIGQRLTIPTGGGSSSAGRTHVVRAGESLAGIARSFGVTTSALAAANGILDTNRIYVGTRLFVDAPAAAAPVGAVTGSYTVRSGDTLASIARRFGSTVSSIASANGIRDPNLVRVGAVLQVPGGSVRCPLPGATYFNDWGFPRSGGRFHEGNDLFAPRGTPVPAPMSGTVAYVTGSLAGLEFKLTGDDGTLFIGSHLDRAGKTGRVSAGDTIGYVGDSGNAKGGRTQLHFEIHPNGGAAVNPYPTVVAACG